MAGDNTDQLIDELRKAITQLSTQYAPADPISIGEVGGLRTALAKLVEQIGLEGTSRLLGESPRTIDTFQKPRGTVNRDTARHFAERLISYFRESPPRPARADLDVEAGSYGEEPETTYLTTEKGEYITTDNGDRIIVDQPPRPSFHIKGTQWVALVKTNALRAKIEAVSKLIDDLVEHSNFANLPAGESGLTQAERDHLIMILQTALNMLQGPMAEKGILEAAMSGLENARLKLAEKGTEYVMAGFVIGIAERLGQIVGSITF